MKQMYFLAILLVAGITKIQAQGIWIPQNSGTTEDLNDVDMFDAQTVRAVGTRSVFLNTVTGGISWNVGATASGNDVDWNGLSFIGPLHAWLVGQNNSLFKGPIWRTADGGTFLPQLLYKYEMFDVAATSTLTAYAACDSATILTTVNAGADWNPLTGITVSDNKFLGLSMYGGSAGFAVGENGLVGKIVNTSFTTQMSPTNDDLNSVFAVNSDTAFACGDNGTVIYTHDNGASWMDASPDSVDFGTLDFHDLFFFNSAEGVVVGEEGTIAWTGDGGVNWLKLSSTTTEDLNAVDFFGQVGFIAGDDGTIFINNDVTIPPFSIEEDLLNALIIYPMPAHDKLNFGELGQELVQVEIANLLGQVIQAFEVHQNNHQVDITSLPNGPYVIKMTIEQTTVSRQLIISK